MSDGRPPRLTLLVPGDPRTATGGYQYDRRITQALQALGWPVEVLSLDPGFPAPSAGALAHADETLASLERGALVMIDGLAFGAMPEVALRHAERLRLVALVHHPLALETGLPAHRARELEHSERAALAAARRVVVTSPETAAALGPYGVSPEHVDVIEPGTDSAPLARHRGDSVTSTVRAGLSLLCVATLTARKGHDLLFAALAALRDHHWHLTCAGSRDLDPGTTARLQSMVTELGLDDRITLAGSIDGDALQSRYRDADLLILPSHYEGYGMAVAEALMNGLPVIATTTGAIPRLVPATAGLLVPPGDAQALQAALARVFNEPGLLDRLGDGAWLARRSLRPWSLAAQELSAALHRVAAQ